MAGDTKVAEAHIEAFRPNATSVRLDGRNFVDGHGRVLDMRGANVGSASKVPLRPCPPFHAHAEASYVGRPFPLDEAREHWRRLRSWGLTFVRITVTWEAVEHAGPGQYDQAYLEYLRELLVGMNEEGVAGYVVIHQDVFSRYCGGSGAPGWTVEAAGFDLSDDGDKLAVSGSAFLDGVRGGRLEGERGLWPTGYQKLACATMSTLFWGGDTFAPSLKVKNRDGETVGIQGYLQDAFLNMVDKVVETVGDLPGVLGFELMNEPHPGYIGSPSINEWNYNTDLHLGAFPTPLQSFSSGAGHPTRVSNWVRTFPWPTRRSGSVLLNPNSVSVWRQDGPTAGECPWEREGVWRWSSQKGRAVPLQSDYFSKNRDGERVDFYKDHYYPFVKRWDAVVRKRQEGKARFVEAVPNEYCPEWMEGDRPGKMVYAPHWYDLNAMFKKSFGQMTVNVQGLSRGMFFLNALYFTRDGAKRNYAKQIATLVQKAREQLGEVPIVFGECGIPMDMNKEEAFKTGDWHWHERMMDSLISALESSMVGFNLWSYNPANRDDIGDDWNAENFSWYSNHQRDLALQGKLRSSGELSGRDLDTGSRLLSVISRPYAIATAGKPLKIEYNYLTAEYTYRFHSPHAPGLVPSSGTPSSAHITEFFLPRVYCDNASKVKHYLSLGGRVVFDYPNQRAYVWYVDTAKKDPQYTAMDGRTTRRFTIWIEGYYEEKPWAWWQRLGLILIFVLGLAMALWLQSVEWANDRKIGLEPWKGVSFLKAKWDL